MKGDGRWLPGAVAGGCLEPDEENDDIKLRDREADKPYVPFWNNAVF